jgi:NADH:ubiquinone oxidoreductase subunit 2 (subunit N)
MAGVPPFIGFFSKLFIITLLVNNAFFILYTLFFIILLIGLYFYVQNIRFLHSTNFSSLNYSYITNERHVLVYYYFTITFLFFFIFGTFYIDDFILLMY